MTRISCEADGTTEDVELVDVIGPGGLVHAILVLVNGFGIEYVTIGQKHYTPITYRKAADNG